MDKFGEHTYSSIFNSSVTLSKILEKSLHNEIQECVAILCPNDASYIVAQWASWMSGQISNLIFFRYLFVFNIPKIMFLYV